MLDSLIPACSKNTSLSLMHAVLLSGNTVDQQHRHACVHRLFFFFFCSLPPRFLPSSVICLPFSPIIVPSFFFPRIKNTYICFIRYKMCFDANRYTHGTSSIFFFFLFFEHGFHDLIFNTVPRFYDNHSRFESFRVSNDLDSLNFVSRENFDAFLLRFSPGHHLRDITNRK
mgnify:CR=1 FL=1